MNEIKKNLCETREIKTTLEKTLTLMEDVMKQFSDVKLKCKELEEKNDRLTEEVKILNMQLRRNNFIIYNVPKTESESVVDRVKEVCAEAEVIVTDQDINNCFRIGRGGEPCPILVSLNSNLLKRKIFNRKELFQQKHYRLGHDRTKEEREEGRRIYACMNKMKELDDRAVYSKKVFRFRGNHYSLKEAEALFIEGQAGYQSETVSEGEQAKKKKRLDDIKERIGQFRFRARSDSATSVRSLPS